MLLSAEEGRDPVVKVLLEAGANTEAKNKLREVWGAVLAVAREVAVVGWWRGAGWGGGGTSIWVGWVGSVGG